MTKYAPEENLAHAIYKAWMADERWLRMDLATLSKGNSIAYFWAEIAARAFDEAFQEYYEGLKPKTGADT